MTETLEPIHDDDNVTMAFPVTKNGSALPITDATILATAKNITSGTVVALSAAVSDGPGGVFTVSIEPGDLTAGIWELQAKATLVSGEIQTPLDRFLTVKPSHDAP